MRASRKHDLESWRPGSRLETAPTRPWPGSVPAEAPGGVHDVQRGRVGGCKRLVRAFATKSPKTSPENRPDSPTSFRATNLATSRGKRTTCRYSRSAESCDAPERIRTSDLRFRRPTAEASGMALPGQIYAPTRQLARNSIYRPPTRLLLTERGREFGLDTDDRVSSAASV